MNSTTRQALTARDDEATVSLLVCRAIRRYIEQEGGKHGKA
jgi:hypothetical protein